MATWLELEARIRELEAEVRELKAEREKRYCGDSHEGEPMPSVYEYKMGQPIAFRISKEKLEELMNKFPELRKGIEREQAEAMEPDLRLVPKLDADPELR